MELAHLYRLVEAGELVRQGHALTDTDPTICPVIGLFVRSWNDDMGDGAAGDADRARVFTPDVLKALLNTCFHGGEEARSWLCTDWAVRVSAPAWLALVGLHDEAALLRGLAPITDAASARVAMASTQRFITNNSVEPRTVGRLSYAIASAASNAALEAACNGLALAEMASVSSDAWSISRWAEEHANALSISKSCDTRPTVLACDTRPTVLTLQASALDLLRRMCAVGRPSVAAEMPQ
jgi:hypothetical protein